MTLLVTVEQFKARARIDHDIEDVDLGLLIEGASGAILDYLKLDPHHYDDSFGDPVDVEPQVQNAVLLLAGILSKDRDGTSMKDWEPGYLPAPVMALLYPLRDPALA